LGVLATSPSAWAEGRDLKPMAASAASAIGVDLPLQEVFFVRFFAG
jgi:hypothetical protein